MDEPHNNPNEHTSPADPFQPHFDSDASRSERTYAMWIHLGALIGWVVAGASQGIGAWLPIVVAGVMWTARKKDSPFIDDHGREALNFQISMILMFLLALVVGLMMCLVGVAVTLPAVMVLAVAGSIMGAVAASKGQYFRYPATFRFLKG